MTTKSTSKFKKIFTKNLIQKSKVILLGIIVASLFLPVLANTTIVNAQVSLEVGSTSNNPCYVSLGKTSYTNSIGVGESILKVNKSTVGLNEEFSIYFEVSLSKELGESCQKTDPGYHFTLIISEKMLLTSALAANFPAKLSQTPSGYKYSGVITTTLAKQKLDGRAYGTGWDLQGYYIYGYIQTPGGNRGTGLGSKIPGNNPYIALDRTSDGHKITNPLPEDATVTTQANLGQEGVVFDQIKFIS